MCCTSPLGVPRAPLGVPRAPLGVPCAQLGVPCAPLGMPRAPPGVPRAPLGVPRDPLCAARPTWCAACPTVCYISHLTAVFTGTNSKLSMQKREAIHRRGPNSMVCRQHTKAKPIVETLSVAYLSIKGSPPLRPPSRTTHCSA